MGTVVVDGQGEVAAVKAPKGGSTERSEFRLSGPILDSPRPLELAAFYEQLLG